MTGFYWDLGWLSRKFWVDGVDGVGVVGFPVVVRIPYDGFLWGNGVLGPFTGFRPGRTNLGGSGGYG